MHNNIEDNSSPEEHMITVFKLTLNKTLDLVPSSFVSEVAATVKTVCLRLVYMPRTVFPVQDFKGSFL